MTTILILHGSDQYEIRKAFSIIQRLEQNVPHRLIPLASASAEINSTLVEYLDFLESKSKEAGLLSTIDTKTKGKTISFERFMLELINTYDKVVILPCEQIVYLQQFAFPIGYALGKGKIAGSLYYPGFYLPKFYTTLLPNTTDKLSELQKILQSL